jgi:hypothetical protein
MPMPTTRSPTMNGPRLAIGGLFAAVVRAKITNTRIAVPTIWSKKAVGMLTPSRPLPGSVEKMPWEAMVCSGSTLAMRSE